MIDKDIPARVLLVFRRVFARADLEITPEMTANDVDGWDSLTHMLLIKAVESEFSIKFKLRELNKMKNIGDLHKLIESKI